MDSFFKQNSSKDKEANKDCYLEIDDELEKLIKYVIDKNENFTGNEKEETLKQLGNAIEKLWKIEAIQATFKKRGGNFSF